MSLQNPYSKYNSATWISDEIQMIDGSSNLTFHFPGNCTYFQIVEGGCMISDEKAEVPNVDIFNPYTIY